VTYELLVENIQDAKTHLQGLHRLLESHGGLQKICAADIITSTMSEMHKAVREIEKYTKHCVEDNGAQTFPSYRYQAQLGHVDSASHRRHAADDWRCRI
jgi:hypothetical protein